MPIRPELQHFYGQQWQEVTRPRILARAGDKCEHCQKPNGALILSVTGRELIVSIDAPYIEPVMFWTLADENAIGQTIIIPGSREIEQRRYRRYEWRNQRGQVDESLWTDRLVHIDTGRRATIQLGPVLVRQAQIGVAHLNHTPGDDREENLRALCNWCHLRYDRDFHRESRRAGRRPIVSAKDAARPLLLMTA